MIFSANVGKYSIHGAYGFELTKTYQNTEPCCPIVNTGPSWTFQAHLFRARKTPGAWWFRNRGPQGRTATHRSQWLFAAGDEHVAPAEDEVSEVFFVFFVFFRGAMGCHKMCRGHNCSDLCCCLRILKNLGNGKSYPPIDQNLVNHSRIPWPSEHGLCLVHQIHLHFNWQRPSLGAGSNLPRLILNRSRY